MVLPSYEEIIISDKVETTRRIIKFDKLSVRIYGDAKYSCTDVTYVINKGCRRRNIDLISYINTINDYFISHPIYKKYHDKIINVYDFNNVKSVTFEGLKLSGLEFNIIRNKYPNLFSVTTKKCTIYKEASIGCLTCHYRDELSDIISLDSFNGFQGNTINLCQSHILNMNKNVLHLNNKLISLFKVKIDYEYFFLTTTAPNMQKIEIHTRPLLNDLDLLFISGFYNLESVYIGAILSSYEQLEKLEKLRELRYVFCDDDKELETVKKKRERIYEKIKNNNGTDKQLKNYLMMQRMIIQNNFLELQHKLYIPRLERVKWEEKISTKELEKIKEELITIFNMPKNKRKNISREKQNLIPTIFESMNGLDFDYTTNEEDEEDVLVDSRPFEGGGIKYYVKRKRIILDK